MKTGCWSNARTDDDVLRALKRIPIRACDTDMDASAFLHGMCAAFALALHRTFGYPIETVTCEPGEDPVTDLCHAYCATAAPDGTSLYADVRGMTDDYAALLSPFGTTCRHGYPVDPASLEAECARVMGRGTLDAWTAAAKQLIAARQDAYCLAAAIRTTNSPSAGRKGLTDMNKEYVGAIIDACEDAICRNWSPAFPGEAPEVLFEDGVYDALADAIESELPLHGLSAQGCKAGPIDPLDALDVMAAAHGVAAAAFRAAASETQAPTDPESFGTLAETVMNAVAAVILEWTKTPADSPSPAPDAPAWT